jgi:uncharacterized membrane protein YbjE (DUF340 family)
MNDKDRELLAQILHAGGSAAQKGFEELVRWCFVDALANVLCYLGVAGLAIFLVGRLFRWQPKDRGEDLPHFFRGAAIALCCIVLAIATGTWLPGNLRELLAPQGEAVAYVLSHH